MHHVQYIVQLPNHLFSLKVKSKPKSGIAFPAFILGAGMVTNFYAPAFPNYTVVVNIRRHK